MNKQSALKIKRLLPVISLALGFVAVAATAAHGTPTPQASVAHGSSTTNSAVTPSPSSSHGPDVTVNGKKVVTDRNGAANLSLPGGGQAKIEIKGDSAKVSSNGSNSGSSASSSNGNLNVSVNSETNGGSGNSHTTIFGSTTSTTRNGSSRSFSSTHVFSTGPAHVEVNNP